MTLAVAGENLIDFVQEDSTRAPPSYVAHPGGSPMNVAMAAARQGVETQYLTPISQDSLGDLIAERLETDGVKIASPRLPNPTSLAMVSLTDGAATYSFYREGTAERQVTQGSLEAAAPGALSAFHIGSLAVAGGAEADVYETFHREAHGRGVLTSYDPNVRASLIPDREAFVARVERIAAHSRLLKLSDEDLAWLYPGTPEADAFEHLTEVSRAPLIVLTRGAKGAKGRAGQVSVEVPAAPVAQLVDTVGAGDTFMATLIRQAMALGGDFRLDDAALSRLLTVASQAAAINCTRAGCQPPTLEELAAVADKPSVG